MKVLILGGGGVFAIHFAKFLLEQSIVESVISVGRNPPSTAPFTLNVGNGDSRYSYHQIHITFEQERLKELMLSKKPNVIVNFAALAYATSWDTPHHYYNTNVTAVAQMCDYLQHVDWLDRFIQIGTSELYGPVVEPASENAPLFPTSPYAVSKLAADMHLETMFRVRKFPMNILRPSNAYGPGQLLYRILPKAVYSVVNNIKVPLEGGGIAKKSYMHATDIARALWLIMYKAPIGEVYNVGPKDPVSIKELVELVAKTANLKTEDFIENVPGRVGEDFQYWLDSSKIISLGYKQSIDLTAGVIAMLDWARMYKNQLPRPQNFVLRA
jgi:dTDP-glucose 4,6-dehydratase